MARPLDNIDSNHLPPPLTQPASSPTSSLEEPPLADIPADLGKSEIPRRFRKRFTREFEILDVVIARTEPAWLRVSSKDEAKNLRTELYHARGKDLWTHEQQGDYDYESPYSYIKTAIHQVAGRWYLKLYIASPIEYVSNPYEAVGSAPADGPVNTSPPSKNYSNYTDEDWVNEAAADFDKLNNK